MQNSFLSVAAQSGTPDNQPQITDETLDALTWEDTTADALIGFSVSAAKSSPGPEGATVLMGTYPVIGATPYAIMIFFSDGESDDYPAGLNYMRATMREAV